MQMKTLTLVIDQNSTTTSRKLAQSHVFSMRVCGFQFDKHLKPPNQRTQQMDTAVFSANSQTGVFDRLLTFKSPKDHWIHRNLNA